MNDKPRIRLMPDEIEAVESLAASKGIAFAMDVLGLDGMGNEFLRLKRLEEQLEAEREAERDAAREVTLLSTALEESREQLETSQREVERLRDWLWSMMNFVGKGHIGAMCEAAIVEGKTLKEFYEPETSNPATEPKS